MTETDPVTRARAIIAEEMDFAHANFTRLHGYVMNANYIDCAFDNAKIQARMLSAQVGAANYLMRMAAGGPPQKSKTNVPLKPVLNRETEEAADAEALDRS